MGMGAVFAWRPITTVKEDEVAQVIFGILCFSNVKKSTTMNLQLNGLVPAIKSNQGAMAARTLVATAHEVLHFYSVFMKY